MSTLKDRQCKPLYIGKDSIIRVAQLRIGKRSESSNHDQKKMNRTSRQECSVKKVFLEILQNSQENTCARVSFFINLQASASA